MSPLVKLGNREWNKEWVGENFCVWLAKMSKIEEIESGLEMTDSNQRFFLHSKCCLGTFIIWDLNFNH